MPTLTALRLASKRKQTLLVELDGAPWKEIDAEVALKFQLKEGGVVDAPALRAIEEENAFVLARRRAVNYALVQPRARREIQRHLAAAKFAPQTIERVMEEMAARGALDDAEVVRRGVRRSQRRQTGPLRLRAELAARGADPGAIAAGLRPLQDARWQADQAAALARKRLERLGHLAPQDRRRRLADYLLRRGFEPEIVDDLLSKLIEGE